MASERHISSTVLPSAWPASICRSSLTICSGVYVLVFTVWSFLALPGRLGLSYHMDQLSGSRPAPIHEFVRLAEERDGGRGTTSHQTRPAAPGRRFRARRLPGRLLG